MDPCNHPIWMAFKKTKTKKVHFLSFHLDSTHCAPVRRVVSRAFGAPNVLEVNQRVHKSKTPNDDRMSLVRLCFSLAVPFFFDLVWKMRKKDFDSGSVDFERERLYARIWCGTEMVGRRLLVIMQERENHLLSLKIK